MPDEEKLKEQTELQNFLAELEEYVKNPSKYVKYEMTNFQEPFTEEEKKAFEEDYTKAVNAFNIVLPDDMKLNLDVDGIRKKINDPEQVEMYRRTSFINELKKKKDDLLKGYKSTFDKETIKKAGRNPLERCLPTLMRADGRVESDNFNKKLMNFYYKYPMEVSQAVLKGIFKADSKVYEGMLMDDYERCKVYTENYERSQIAYDTLHIMDEMEKDGNLVAGLKKNPMIPLLQAQDSLNAKFGSNDSFAMPELTGDQLGKISVQAIPATIPYLNRVAVAGFDSGFKGIKDEIKLLKEKGFLNDKETALTYKAVEVKDGKEKEISLLDALTNNYPNVKIVKRSEEEKQNMLFITNGIKVRCFEDAFVSSYNSKNPQTKIDKYNQDMILDQNKGGFFERLFNTTSKEYRDFTDALKNYTDRESPDFGNHKMLVDAAKAYLEHKKVTDEQSIEKLDSTGRNRVKLCQAVIDAVDNARKPVIKEMDEPVKNAIDDEIKLNASENGPKREPILGLENDTNIEKTTTTTKETKVESKTVQVEVEKVVS